jgi:hypothetical protein
MGAPCGPTRGAEHRGEPRLLEEETDLLRHLRQLGPQPFDDALARELLRPFEPRGEYFGHATLTDLLEENVAPELDHARGDYAACVSRANPRRSRVVALVRCVTSHARVGTHHGSRRLGLRRARRRHRVRRACLQVRLE